MNSSALLQQICSQIEQSSWHTYYSSVGEFEHEVWNYTNALLFMIAGADGHLADEEIAFIRSHMGLDVHDAEIVHHVADKMEWAVNHVAAPPKFFRVLVAHDGARGTSLSQTALDFSVNAHHVLGLTFDLGRGNNCETVTYIVSKRLRDETDGIARIGRLVYNYDREQAIRNLLVSHHTSSLAPKIVLKDRSPDLGTQQRDLAPQPPGQNDSFLELFREEADFAGLFWYDEHEWSQTISRLRLFYHLIQERNGDSLLGWLITDIISLERKLRAFATDLDEMLRARREVPDPSRDLEPKCTMSNLVIWLRKNISSECKGLMDGDNPAKSDLSSHNRAISSHRIKNFFQHAEHLASDRNWLVHGYVENVFLATQKFAEDMGRRAQEITPADLNRLREKEHLWELFIYDYVMARLGLPLLQKIKERLDNR